MSKPLDGDILSYQATWVADTAKLRVWDSDRRMGSSFAAARDVANLITSSDGGACIVVVHSLADGGVFQCDVDAAVGARPVLYPLVVTVDRRGREVELALRGKRLGPDGFTPELLLFIDESEDGGVVNMFFGEDISASKALDAVRRLGSIFEPRRLAVIFSGGRDGLPAFMDRCRADNNVSCHTTKIGDHRRELTRFVARLAGETWTEAYEAAWIARLVTVFGPESTEIRVD